MQRSLFQSFFSNWFGLVGSVVIGFFLSPFVVSMLGSEAYGAWTLIVSLSSQLIVLDFGVRHALVRFVAQILARGDRDGVDRFVSSARTVLMLAGSAALLLLSLMTPFFGEWFHIPPALVTTSQIALLIMAVDAGFDLLFGLYHGTLLGCERYDVVNGVNVLRLFVNAILVVCVLTLGGGLIGMAAITLLTRALQRLLLRYFTLKQLPYLSLSFKESNREDLKKILHFGFWVCMIAVATRAIAYLDTLVIGSFLAPDAVTTYAVALLAIDYFRMLLQSSSTVLTPRLSSLAAQEDSTTSKELLFRWARYSHMLSLGVGIPLLICGTDFLVLWMGAEFETSGSLLCLLVLPFFVTVPALAFQNALLAHARHSLVALVLFSEALCNLGLSLWLMPALGLKGVALGTVIPAILFGALAFPFLACRRLRISFLEYLIHSYILTLPLAAFQLLWIAFLYSQIGAYTWSSFILMNGLGVTVFGAVCFGLLLSREDREYVRRRLRAIR